MIKACKRCGILFRGHGCRKYCVVCSYEVKLEYYREYHRHWREANRDKVREKDRRYRERHREKIKAYNREYRRRQKLKLIREVLSAAKEAFDRE